MKKLIAFLLVLVMMLSVAACAPAETPDNGENQTPPESAGMTYAEFVAAEQDAEVVVEFYVQATQGWWFDSEAGHGKITIYGQAKDGGYFAYEVNCDEETGKKIVAGAKVRVTGDKAVWNGLAEIMNGTIEVLEGDTWTAEALDITALLGTEELEGHMNKKIAIKGATVEASNEAGDVFLYKYNGSGKEGDDLYFKVAVGEKSYTMVVESYLCGLGSDTYEAVRGLKVGDKIDLEGYLYWYNEAQPHIYSVKAAQ